LIRPAVSHQRIGDLKILEIVLVLVFQFFGVRFPATLLVGILIEALCISRVPDGWDDRTSILAIIYVIPEYALEKGMWFNPRGTPLDISKSVRSIDCAELKDYIFRFFGKVWLGGEMNRFGNNPK
jgi:hypothetical protein